MSLPQNPSNGQIALFGGGQYQFDGVSNRWVLLRSSDVIELENRIDSDLSNFRFNDLVDVSVSYPPDHNTILSWDSDLQNFKTRQFTNDPLGAIAFHNDFFVSQNGQTQFRLKYFPIGDVEFIRNGVKLNTDCYSVSGKDVTYIPSNNGERNLINDDSIIISYNYGTSIALTAELADLTDVDVTTTLPKNGDVLAWDSDSAAFVPSTDLKDDITQAVSDRIFTDNVLSQRIDDVDSDLNSRGRFYVQPTPPVGSSNSGWVNTTNMKLYVYDTSVQTWIQVTLT